MKFYRMAKLFKDPIIIRSNAYVEYPSIQEVMLTQDKCATCPSVIQMEQLDTEQALFCATYAPGKYCTLSCLNETDTHFSTEIAGQKPELTH